MIPKRLSFLHTLFRISATLFVAACLASCGHPPGAAEMPQTLRSGNPGGPPILHLLPLFYYPGGTQGIDPVPVLAGDPAVAMYGVTTQGGKYGYGTIYKLTYNNPNYTETVIHDFDIRNLSDGAYPAAPLAPLIPNSSGNLYGTTEYGGRFGQGTVFEISTKTDAFTQLHSFAGGSDGALPASILHIDKSGALFGTTLEGGCTQAGGGCCPIGCGTVYKLIPSGGASNEQPIYRFQGGSDGIYPWGGVEETPSGLYGTTYAGGSNLCGGGGCGTIYRLQGSGFSYTLTTIHSFGNTDGAHPHSRLLANGGTLYGTTLNGGAGTGCANGCGTIFSIIPGSAFTTLHSFLGGSDGNYPYTGLTYDAGVLYGTTLNGGDTTKQCAGQTGCGVIFSITPTGGSYDPFYQFAMPPDGNNPNSAVFTDQKTSIVYGTTSDGGDATHTHGMVFQLHS